MRVAGYAASLYAVSMAHCGRESRAIWRHLASQRIGVLIGCSFFKSRNEAVDALQAGALERDAIRLRRRIAGNTNDVFFKENESMVNMKPLAASLALCCALATGAAYAQTAPPTAPTPATAPAAPEATAAPTAGGAMQQAAPPSSGAASDTATSETAKPAAEKPAKHKKHSKKAAAGGTDPTTAPASGDATH